MIENFEFWALFISVLTGFATVIKQNMTIKDALREEEKTRETNDRKIFAEFEKCRLHQCHTSKFEVNNE